MQDAREIFTVFYSQIHEITKDGRLLSIASGHEHSYDNTNNYKYCRLSIEGKKLYTGIHRLIAICYHGQPPTPKHVARHKDGNRQNNHYTNIEWGTPEQNAADKKRHGTDNLSIWNNKTPEEREHIRKTRQTGVQLYWDRTNKNERHKRGKKIQQFWDNLTPEQRKAHVAQINAARLANETPENRQARLQRASENFSNGMKAYWAKLTPQERFEKRSRDQKKAWKTIKQKQLEQINQGRTRPYLDAGLTNGPQLDLFQDEPPESPPSADLDSTKG